MRNWNTSPSGVASGASSGSTPGGNSSTAPTRCSTMVRAGKLSVPSEKVSVMIDKPNWLSLRMRVMFGVPFSARSSGTVTRRSTSSAALPGSLVMTLTCVLVTSG
jgi:hypothetical protein